MKRVSVLFFAVLLFAPLATMVASAQTEEHITAKIAVGAGTGQAGGTVTVPVTFTPGPTDAVALQFKLFLLPGVSFDSIKAGDAATTAGLVFNKPKADGPFVEVVAISSNPFEPKAIGKGVLCWIVLKLDRGLAGKTRTVGLGDAMLASVDAKEIPVAMVSGSVTITSPPGNVTATVQ